MVSEAAAKMPAEFEGKREAEIWARVMGTRKVTRLRTEQAAAAVRALADEETAREEMQRALEGGDSNGARTYAGMARDMRAQAAKLLSEIPSV